MALWASLLSGLIASGQIDQAMTGTINSSAQLVEYAATHSNLRWDAAADSAVPTSLPGGVIEAVSCFATDSEPDNTDVRKLLLLRGLATISRTRHLTVYGSEAIANGSLSTKIHEQSIGLVNTSSVVATMQVPAKPISFVCALISGVVGE